MFTDAAIVTLTRPGIARVYLEVNLMKQIPNYVWIGMESEASGFWQDIVWENLPHAGKWSIPKMIVEERLGWTWERMVKGFKSIVSDRNSTLCSS